MSRVTPSDSAQCAQSTGATVDLLGLLLYRQIDLPQREAIITRVLDVRDTLSTPTRDQLARVVQANLRIPGFRKVNVWKAPLNQLVDHLDAASLQYRELAEALLLAWLETEDELCTVIASYMRQTGQVVVIHHADDRPVDTEAHDGDNHVLVQGSPALNDFTVAEAFVQRYPQFDAIDVILAFACAPWLRIHPEGVLPDSADSSAAALPAPEGEIGHDTIQPPEKATLLWDQWLTILQGLPAWAPEWPALQGFLEAVQALAQKKQEEAAVHAQIEQELVALQLVPLEQLTYLGLEEVRQWRADEISADDLQSIVANLGALRSLIEQYQTLEQRSVATAVERREKDQQLRILEDRIWALRSPLAAGFSRGGLEASLSTHQDDKTGQPPVAQEIHSDQPTVDADDQSDMFDLDAALEIAGEETASTTDITLPLDWAGDIRDVPVSEDRQELEEAEQAGLEPQPAGREEGKADGDLPAKWSIQPSPKDEELTSLALLSVCEPEAQATPPADWHTLLWSLLQQDDLVGAYWLTKSWPLQGEAPPLASDLLAAMQAARWLSINTLIFTADLQAIVNRYQPDPSTPIPGLLAVAAALQPAVLVPMSGLQNWLTTPTGCGWLDELLVPISEFARFGIGLSPDAIPGLADASQLEEELAQVVAKTNEWLQTSRRRRSHLKRAVDVWHKLVDDEGAIAAFLAPVIADRRDLAAQVEKDLSLWRDPLNASAKIDVIDRSLGHGHRRKIEGGVRQYLMRNIDEATAFADQWLQLVMRSGQQTDGGTWLLEQAQELRRAVMRALPAVISSLDELLELSQPPDMRAAALCLHRAVFQLARTVGLSVSADPVSTNAPYASWFVNGISNLEQALNRRLLWLPELVLEDDGAPAASALPQIGSVLADAWQRTPQAAFRRWLDKQDYRFVSLLRSLDPTVMTDDAEIESLRTGSIAALRDLIRATEAEVEQAVVDGILNDAERAEYHAQIMQLEPENILNFDAAFERLNHIQSELAQARSSRMEVLRQDWEQIQRGLSDSLVSAEKQDQIRTMLERGLDRKDTRVVEESLAHLRGVLETGGDLTADSWFSPRRTTLQIKEFVELLPQLEDALERSNGFAMLSRALEQGQTWAGLEFGGVPRKRRDEALQVIKAWRALKQHSTAPHDGSKLQYLLQYLGFTLTKRMAVETIQSGSDWLYVQAHMSDGGLARPIPQFGSEAKGLYHVVCFWGRPGITTLATQLAELRLDSRPTLVFYFGRLTAKDRRELVGRSRERGLMLVVLDETLLVYLAKEHDARLPAFLRCTLPYATLSPYVPFHAGNVPPEMFFGRRLMLNRLQDIRGSCIVYGGRQLGKSSLLRQAEREFHNPSQEHYAWFADIKRIGDRAEEGDPETVWQLIREGMKERGVLGRQISTRKTNEIIRHLREAILSHPTRRVLILLDEADNFLDADAAKQFRVIEQFRTLMSDTQRRFKVVLAGLHNVQRFQGSPNQPLAHFGDPICVGPLEPKDAMALVREPLEMLGYRFADAATNNATLLRTLSYTNYHPALIQLFCQELLNRLHRPGRPAYNSPPFSIQQSDVETVYRNPSVRQRIRERFDWTLELDTRYQAIVWSLVEDQVEQHDSYAQAYAVRDILQLVQGWWPKGFHSTDIDRLRGLLDELVGLGILVRTADGRYRLRSPNLVRLMGTEQDIEARLLELSDKEIPASFSADSYHMALDDGTRHYSPLTYAQERRLHQPKFGVALIFASEASGWPALGPAIESFRRKGGVEQGWPVEQVPASTYTAAALDRWLGDYLARHPDQEQLFAYLRLNAGEGDALAALVRTAEAFCNRQRSDKRWMRIILLFNPRATWNWLLWDEESRSNLEACADAVTYPTQWDFAGVYRCLEEQNMIASESICTQILEATGGWPLLVNELLERCERHMDPKLAAEAMHHELEQSVTPLRTTFMGSLAVESNRAAKRVLQGVLDLTPGEEGVPVDWITPDYLDDTPPLSSDECSAAVEYLIRMGLLLRRGDAVIPAPLVARLFSNQA